MAENSEQLGAVSKDAVGAEDKKAGVSEVQATLSKVASDPKGRTAILVVVVLIFGYAAFNMLSSDDASMKQVVVPKPEVVVKPPSQDTVAQEISKAPALPDLPKLVAPVLPPPPPAPDAEAATTPSLPTIQPQSIKLPTSLMGKNSYAERQDAKRQASIMLIAGVPQAKTPAEISAQEDFKMRGDLTYVLGKGKIIDAVLETAINTDFGGDVRAVISRDVFSESGKVVLIAKGSRIFGSYSQSVQSPYGKVDIAWTRVDLPSGYTVNLAGQAVDHLGRKGVSGRLDNKYSEIFSDAVLTSAFNIAFAGALDKITPPPISQNTAATNQALSTSINNAVSASVAQGAGNPQTTITLICNQIPQLIPDKTSQMYASINASCQQYQNPIGGSTPAQNLQALMSAITNSTGALSQNTAIAVTPSQAQEASKAAFKDITGALKEMVNQKKTQPTITVNQGDAIKIYVNKDYTFPRKITTKTTVLQ